MEQVTDAIGNPTALLLERIFWLGLGGFFGLALITSILRGIKDRKNKTKPISAEQLKDLAKNAIKKNSDSS